MTNNDLGRLMVMCVITAVWALAVTEGAVNVLSQPGMIVPITTETTLQMWQAEVREWSWYVLGGALLMAVGWYFYALSRHIRLWHNSVNHRAAWAIGLVLAGVVAVGGGMQMTTVDGGIEYVYGVYVFHGCGLYYLTTVLCSPPRWKYTPVLAAYLRFF